MNRFLSTTSVISAMLLAGTMSLSAGNMPQYNALASNATMEIITDGTPIRNNPDSGTTVIFPDYQGPNEHSGPGFPINFDFRMGGQLFDQFACSAAGGIYLGDGNVNFVPGAPYNYVEEEDAEQYAFAIHMSPIMLGLETADISYKTIQENGENVLVLQYLNAVLAEENATDKGKYNLQFRLHEKDGIIEVVFQQINPPAYNANGFNASLTGWDKNDVFVLTAPSMLDPVSVSTFKKPYMLDGLSYIHWTRETEPFTRKITYTPYLDQRVPQAAPMIKEVTQTESTINIEVTRGRGAASTVVLVSENPITPADMPADGETFRASSTMMIGDAYAIYYGNDSNISVSFDNVKPSTDYHIVALSASGYPMYNVDKVAEVVYHTTQDAPDALFASPVDINTIKVDCRAKVPVIIAATTEVNLGYKLGYTGNFGMPEADVQVGDVIEGGGKVIFVGDPAEFTYKCDPNSMVYFRAWTLENERVSSTWVNAFSIPEISMPYAPAVNDYPWGEKIYNWTTDPEGEVIPWVREYYKDRTLYTILYDPALTISLTSPELPLDTPVNLTFEFAMETERDPAATPDSGGIKLPRGCEPGWFGRGGFLKISTGDKVQKVITEYHGEMVPFGEDGYCDFSSSFESVSLDIPSQNANGKITFSMRTQKNTRFFIRNIVVTPLEKEPEAPAEAPSMVTVGEDEDGVMTLTCQRGEDAANTLVLFSETPMTDKEVPTDGISYKTGDSIGDAIVLYFGDDKNVSCSTVYSVTIEGHTQYFHHLADYDTDYYFRTVSANTNPMYNTANMNDVVYHSEPDPNKPNDSVETISDGEGDSTAIFTVTGIKVNTTDLNRLPAGLYIINGKKFIKK